MTVVDNIAFGLKMRKFDSQARSKAVAEVIELVELQGKNNNFPINYQGTAPTSSTCKSISDETANLLLDEPLSALDARIRKHASKFAKFNVN